jgi:[ribosomal protein S18]-alanine N-acetyltransferase
MIEAVGAEAADLLADLHTAAFPNTPWRAAEIARLLENPAAFALLSRGKEPQGFVMAWAAAGESEILTLAVLPAARRMGVGASLVTAASVAALVRGAATMHLEVAETNEAARGLYKKLGYEEAGRRNAYYSGEGGAVDALVLRRALPRPVV